MKKKKFKDIQAEMNAITNRPPVLAPTQIKLGDKLWVQNGPLKFEVKVSYTNHGDFWASPTTEDYTEGHYVGCVAVKIASDGKLTFF